MNTELERDRQKGDFPLNVTSMIWPFLLNDETRFSFRISESRDKHFFVFLIWNIKYTEVSMLSRVCVNFIMDVKMDSWSIHPTTSISNIIYTSPQIT